MADIGGDTEDTEVCKDLYLITFYALKLTISAFFQVTVVVMVVS